MGMFDRGRRAEAVSYSATRPIVASAARLHLGNKSEVEATRQRSTTAAGWQGSAWQCYGNVGEVNYAFNYAASVLGRIRFHAAVVTDSDSAPVEAGAASRVVTDGNGSTRGVPNGIDPRLAKKAIKYMSDLGGAGGQMSVMAKAFGLNYQVVGECYLVNIDGKWSIKSTSEIKVDSGGNTILQPSQSINTLTPRKLKKGTPIGRIWNSHPRYSADSDSSLRAVLSDCEELILLSRLMRVAARSRLNAGILFIPDTMSAAARTVGEDDVTDPDAVIEADDDNDPLEKELYDSMTAPVSEESNAAAIVPLLIRGPAEDGSKILYIQMTRAVGDELAARSKDVLNRVLQGINAPKELATGMSGSRYNNAQLIDEQSYKALVEPLALVFSDSVTEIYLTPMLRAFAKTKEAIDWGLDDLDEQIERIVCWYDPSEVVTSVDQSAAANDGWDRHVLSDAAWRKAHGFGEADKPSEGELTTRLALAQVALPQNIQQALFQAVFPELFRAAQLFNQQQNGVGVPSGLSDLLQGGAPSTTPGASAVAPSPPVPASSVPAGATA